MSDITPCLWFDHEAEEAAEFYVAIFRKAGRSAEITAISHYGAAGPGPRGGVLTVAFKLGDQELLGLNGGPHFKPSPATSLTVNCRNQNEIDHFWAALSEGGETGQCGWLTDRYGFSWQIAPAAIATMLAGVDEAGMDRFMARMRPMTRLDIAALQDALATKGAA